jgi:hypothetical protein
MGLAYYRLDPDVLESVRELIAEHEADPLGPRARGYWMDSPDEYDYEEVRRIGQVLDQTGKQHAHEQLELSEVQAHALSMLEMELPADDEPLAPTLFTTSVTPLMLELRMELAHSRLGTNPERIAAKLTSNERDKRFAGYMRKQMRHLREALPLVWHFYERAAEAGDAILVVDLRARDLEIPDAVELGHVN